MAQTLEQAQLADQVGLDVFGVGEHHRSDFVSSEPHMVLAAAAAGTRNIKLTGGVTVLSSEDPVRVFEHFGTLDVISNGRAEIIAGRGSYTESFPLFGYDLADYADLFREKLELLLAIRAKYPITWEGAFRPPLVNADIAPRPVGDLPISINAHGYVSRTSQGARETMFPYFRRGMRENNHQRGEGFDIPQNAFDAQSTAGGGLLVGSVQEIIDKLLTYHELYGVSRAVLQMGFGGVPQKAHLEAIELLGTQVAPVIRREIASREGVAA